MSEKIKVYGVAMVKVGNAGAGFTTDRDAHTAKDLCLAAHALGVTEECARWEAEDRRFNFKALWPTDQTTPPDLVKFMGVEYRRVDAKAAPPPANEPTRIKMYGRCSVTYQDTGKTVVADFGPPPTPAWQPPTKAETAEYYENRAWSRVDLRFGQAWCVRFALELGADPRVWPVYTQADDALALQMALERSV